MAHDGNEPSLSAAQVERLIRPKSVAVVGASDKPGALGTTLLSNLERNGFAGDDVLERAALPAWENSLVDGSAVLRLAENAAAARAAQGLVRGEGDDVSVWNWVGVRATCNETGQVRSTEVNAVCRSESLTSMPSRVIVD